MNIFGLLAAASTRDPSAGAVFLGKSLIWTYSQLHQRALRLAANLRKRLSLGDRVVIVSENCPAYLDSSS